MSLSTTMKCTSGPAEFPVFPVGPRNCPLPTCGNGRRLGQMPIPGHQSVIVVDFHAIPEPVGRPASIAHHAVIRGDDRCALVIGDIQPVMEVRVAIIGRLDRDCGWSEVLGDGALRRPDEVAPRARGRGMAVRRDARRACRCGVLGAGSARSGLARRLRLVPPGPVPAMA